jgi:predicted hotdog family 3-hydroxylacyl-ACP dehydratase
MINMQADPKILELIPHRPPMLLIQGIRELTIERSQSLLTISDTSSFYTPGIGVPAWVGLEYMGQTAALIAGYQQQIGHCEPHLGFLLGCRDYSAKVSHFHAGQSLCVTAEQSTVVGESLATFKCTIAGFDNKTGVIEAELATAQLSVFRQPMRDQDA